MLLAVIFLLFSLCTLIINVITVIAIIRKRIAPSYFKIKLSFVLNGIMTIFMGVMWSLNADIGNYDFMWLIIYLLLMVWYGFIMANRPTDGKSSEISN